MPTTPVHFTLADLEQWVEKGLITPEQLANIRSYIEATGSREEQVQTAPEQRKGLNFVSLAYYFGGFMISHQSAATRSGPAGVWKHKN
ncbi:MAG: hypothetical protein J7454_07295 [Roseiflexus sp.]|jgi:hypothetical protein|nr:hypothetical protein [Roseiflexus sp.]MBO9366301.1 hypothetical protein [Roseiflexus sp.]MBO9383819.1 hypothetical protein [Roseiflexus sp.]